VEASYGPPGNRKFKSARGTVKSTSKVPKKQSLRSLKISKKRSIKEHRMPKPFVRQTFGIDDPLFFDLLNSFENPMVQKEQLFSGEIKPSTENLENIREPSIPKENSEDEDTKYVSPLVNHLSMPNIWDL
jgi:hypothetical protein